jgi:hypothetical protein
MLLSKASNTNISAQTINAYLAEKDHTQSVKLEKTIPVELRYETIVLEDGKLHIYKDVYSQDTNTEENLRAVLDANGIRFDDLSEQQRAEALAALKTVSTDAKKKEVVIDLTDVADKGYPAPVNLDNGSGKPVPQKGTKKATKNTNH